MNAANFKEAAHRLVDALPDNATWDDVMRKAYERQAIESGLADSEVGRVTDVEAVRGKYGLPHQVGRSGGCAGGIPRGTAIARCYRHLTRACFRTLIGEPHGPKLLATDEDVPLKGWLTEHKGKEYVERIGQKQWEREKWDVQALGCNR